MLRRTLTICTLTISPFIGLQATEQEIPSSSHPREIINENKDQQEILACKKDDQQEILACEEGSRKDLTPGVLVCNSSEKKCTREGHKEESSSSKLFSVFSNDHKDEENLLACKNCR